MRREGFTLLETLIVLVVVGLMLSIGLPKIRSALQKTNVRSARVSFGGAAARARATALARGCLTTVNYTSGTAGRVWVTTCKVSGVGTDTVGPVELLAARYSVSIASATSSLQYDPRGISLGFQPRTVSFTSTTGNVKDSTMINELGRVVR
ncbi:MAG TPA: type II secretion system protein [Gemmatimonadales bacterium]|nr:type II secretion system protein [Gemmatimonadales bacterium]